MDSSFRPLTGYERGLLERLLEPQFPGRDELRRQMSQTPRVLRFRGLRCCVKRLAGAQRWSLRCQCLQDRIVEYLRECLSAERRQTDFALVVE